MIIQGPLALNWKNRKYGILPRIENGAMERSNIAIQERIDLWVKQHIHVKEKPNWVFVKVHCHGAQEANMEFLLKGYLDRMFSYLEAEYNDLSDYILHYITAREMYNIIKAAETGCQGNPGNFRDFRLIFNKDFNSSS